MKGIKLTFVGVGEAFDEKLKNSSLLVECGANILIDCGFSAVSNVFKATNNNPDFVDIVYITHFHADHYFGVAPLLVRLNEDGRKKPIVIMGQKGISNVITSLMKVAYPGSLEKLQYPIKFVEAQLEKEVKIGNIAFSFFESKHAVKNYSIKIETNGFSLFYSGDGEITKSTLRGIASSKIVVHECYTYDEHTPFHSSYQEIEKSIKSNNNVEKVFLVHINRNIREKVINSNLNEKFFIPHELQVFSWEHCSF